jgi:hypothetical protein
MSVTDVPSSGGPATRNGSRRIWKIGGAVVLTAVLIGAGIGIGAAIWSGGSSSTCSSGAAFQTLNATKPCPNAAAPPNGGRLPGDYVVTAVATFSVGSGATVSIVGGGGGADNSNCTNAETVTSFTTRTDTEDRLFQITAKTGGSCAVEPSYSNFKVSITGPDFKASGRMWLGQVAPGDDYFVSCYSGSPSRIRDRNYEWSRIGCVRTADRALKIVRT